MSRSTIPQKDVRLLLLRSGGICAFPTCNARLVIDATSTDDPAIIGQIAHIVADSRQGPRGSASISEEDRNKYPNLILLCSNHHKLIDSQPMTYSIPVLLQMKADHEERIRKATGGSLTESRTEYREDTLYSTLLRVSHLPRLVFTAQCGFADDQGSEVHELIDYSKCHNQLMPFLLRGKEILTFQDLRTVDGPFRAVIGGGKVSLLKAEELWRDPEGNRRYVILLNRALHKYTRRLKVGFDAFHKRFYFPVIEPGKERSVRYRSLTGKHITRRVVWQPTRRRTGEGRNFWWHLAAGLKFKQLGKRQWCLAIRPERHLTKDSQTPFPPEFIGRRVTRLKARMYNALYLGEVNFWRDFLSSGQPRIILRFGDQHAVIEAQFTTLPVHWPGIPGDDKSLDQAPMEEDLFTLADLQEAVSGEEADWEDDSSEGTED